ncbi:MAG: hypothetical protein ACI9HK_005386, partial [Pirellulaceae bacterium]
YESGLHVPLVVRVPENFKHLAAFARGSRTNGFVSFVDFGPTVLRLAGAKSSKVSDGVAFLGKDTTSKEVASRDEAFGYADRFDEKYEFVRTLRKGKYKYMRNYQAFYPDGLQNNYRYKMLAYSQWRKLYNDGKLNDVQSQFFLPKQAEALYDIEADPHEVNNLAGDPQFADTLLNLRTRLQNRVRAINDLSLLPESVMIAEALGNPVEYGREHAQAISKLLDVIDLAVLPFEQAKPKLIASLHSHDSLEKYWVLQACSTFGKEAESLADDARKLLKDDEQLVRVRAAEFLAVIGAEDPRPTILEVLRTSKSAAANLITLNTVVFLKDGGLDVDFQITRRDVPARSGEVDRRLLYLTGK